VHRIGRTGRAGRSGTAISIVTSVDQKAMAAIEKLIGQTIPRTEGDIAVQPEEAPVAAGNGREQSRGRDGSRGRKPRRERDGRRSNGNRNHAPQPQAAASHVPSIGRAEPPQEPRDATSEPADHSHLPAFLLRPIRSRRVQPSDER